MSDGYKIVLVLHLLAVMVGFGGLFLNAAYGLQARARSGREGLAIAEALYNVSRKWTEYFIYAVPILGIALVMMSEDTIKFSDMWVSASFVVYIVALGVLHGLQFPNIKRMNQMMAELAAAEGRASGSTDVRAELERRGKRSAVVGGIFNLLIVAAVVLMVFKPT
jgi:uncharacterized membrane protein